MATSESVDPTMFLMRTDLRGCTQSGRHWPNPCDESLSLIEHVECYSPRHNGPKKNGQVPGGASRSVAFPKEIGIGDGSRKALRGPSELFSAFAGNPRDHGK